MCGFSIWFVEEEEGGGGLSDEGEAEENERVTMEVEGRRREFGLGGRRENWSIGRGAGGFARGF